MIRVGVLGTAAIAPWALLRPAKSIPEIQVSSVASRSPDRAQRFAARHGIPRVHRSYDDLILDRDIDAVYVPLPVGLHAHWVTQALRAGKHVLCEKPLASNADQARHLGELARESNLVLMEAMHYRHHPLAARAAEIIRDGALGSVHHIDARFNSPSLLRPGFRSRYELGGGAAMDLGCYPVSLVRLLGGGEPEVVDARASLLSAQVDRAMQAEMVFPNGCRARISCSMLSFRLLSAKARVLGGKGELSISNPFHPYLYNRLRLRLARGNSSERVEGRSTFYYQLLAFYNAVCHGDPVTTDADEACNNLKVIDSVYTAAGLLPRGLAADPKDYQAA